MSFHDAARPRAKEEAAIRQCLLLLKAKRGNIVTQKLFPPLGINASVDRPAGPIAKIGVIRAYSVSFLLAGSQSAAS